MWGARAMIGRLRALWIGINASYWFYPALFSLLAVILSAATVQLDKHGAGQWIVHQGWIAAARPDGASNILTVIAGSMIGVASTVFSITIAAVAYASGNYGPRLLTNFMSDKGNQLSLGSFISTFVYAVLVLRAVRTADEAGMAGYVPQLSLLVATILMAISVAVLVFFLNHIPSSIRINTVLEGIGSRLIKDISDRFPRDYRDFSPDTLEGGTPIVAPRSGYVTIIDYAGLDDIAREHEVKIVLQIRTGDFVHPELPLVHVHGGDVGDITDPLHDKFSVGALRTPEQDPDFLFDELAEIALRALSPGINDPFTAVTSIHWLSAATAELAKRDLSYGPEDEDYDRDRIFPLPDGFEHFLKRGFGAVRPSAAASPIAGNQYLEGLASIAIGCTSRHRRMALAREADRLIEQARLELAGPALEGMEEAYVRLRPGIT